MLIVQAIALKLTSRLKTRLAKGLEYLALHKVLNPGTIRLILRSRKNSEKSWGGGGEGSIWLFGEILGCDRMTLWSEFSRVKCSVWIVEIKG